MLMKDRNLINVVKLGLIYSRGVLKFKYFFLHEI